VPVPSKPGIAPERLRRVLAAKAARAPRPATHVSGRRHALDRGRRSFGLHHVVNYGGNEHLYDLAVDPSEKAEIKGQHPLALRYFRDPLQMSLDEDDDVRLGLALPGVDRPRVSALW